MVDALEYWKHICMRIASELLAAKPELVRGFSTSLRPLSSSLSFSRGSDDFNLPRSVLSGLNKPH
tara:strand:- start:192 stop:386 length:195 start_codon:yes stop_codon:yes gene_type:complete